MIATIASLAVGCAGGSDNPGGGAEECDEDQVGEDCTCGDGDEEQEGKYECVGEDLSCDCEGATDGDDDEGDDDDTVPPGDDDEGDDDDTAPPTPVKDAAVDARITLPMRDGGGSDARVTPVPTNDGGSTMLPPASGGSDPILPEIMGECPTFRNGTIMAGGRGNIQIIAGDANKKGPLIFYWHGTGSSSAVETRSMLGSVLNQITSAGGIVAAFNGGSSKAAGGGADCSGTGTHSPGDFVAADVIAACAVKNHGIDQKRIYTTGCSAGGLQAGCMGQMRSNYIAAVAPNSGGIVAPKPWQGMTSPAVFSMHGGPRDMVIVTFSQTSARYNMAAKAKGSFVVNCDHGGGHCSLPSGLMDAAYKFMTDHPYGASKDSPWKSGIPSGVPSYCKIF